MDYFFDGIFKNLQEGRDVVDAIAHSSEELRQQTENKHKLLLSSLSSDDWKKRELIIRYNNYNPNPVNLINL